MGSLDRALGPGPGGSTRCQHIGVGGHDKGRVQPVVAQKGPARRMAVKAEKVLGVNEGRVGPGPAPFLDGPPGVGDHPIGVFQVRAISLGRDPGAAQVGRSLDGCPSHQGIPPVGPGMLIDRHHLGPGIGFGDVGGQIDHPLGSAEDRHLAGHVSGQLIGDPVLSDQPHVEVPFSKEAVRLGG